MKKLLLKLYAVYCALLFLGVFLWLLPAFLLLIWVPRWRIYTAFWNRIWAKVFLTLAGIPLKRVGNTRYNHKGQYIVVANHFSFLDIVTIGYTNLPILFVGKNSLKKVPLFGYMYGNLHLTVDRSNAKSMLRLMDRSRKALDKGFSLVMYAEGGMRSTNPPQMAPFKEGAFRLAIEKQIPILPVSLPFNWIILPQLNEFTFRPKRPWLTYHAPIDTKGMTLDDVDALKNRVFGIIQGGIDEHCPTENRTEQTHEN